jgi:hypothetical protein
MRGRDLRTRMNTLKDYITSRKLDETKILNILQDHGIISDNCVTSDEVIDSGKAVAWIELNEEKL